MLAQRGGDKILENLPAQKEEAPEEVPDLKGKTYGDARQKGESMNLNVTTDQSDAKDDWMVIEQTPAAGTKPIPENRTISVNLKEKKEDEPVTPEVEEKVPRFEEQTLKTA